MAAGEEVPLTRRHALWVAPALTAILMLSVYAAFGLYPFGTGTVAWCDMKQQVIPFLLDFRNIMTGGADMFLNLQNAGGMNFWGVFLFFISSPFTFLVLLIPKSGIYLFVNILLILKMMTCALTAGVWFRRKFSNLTALQAAALSLMYAFCGYTMFYYQNIVWLDMMYLFPLLMIGLEKLAEEGRPLCYTLVFAAMLTVNFYLSYMVVVFLILGAGIYLLLCVPKGQRGGKLLTFGAATLVSALMTGVVWLPSLLQYLSSARTGDLLSSLRSGSLLADVDTTLPVLLCTGAVFAGAAIVLALRGYRAPKTRWLVWMLFLTAVPVFLEPVNKMWQTGSYQSFPVRYGYIPVFLGLTLFASCVSAANRGRDRLAGGAVPLAVCAAAVAVAAFCAGCVLRYGFNDAAVYTHTLWGDLTSLRILLLFAAVTGTGYLTLFLERRYGRIGRAAFSVLLCILAAVESIFSADIYIGSAGNRADAYDPVLSLGDRIGDDSLYRVKLNRKYFDVNLLGSVGYNSMSHYTSLTSKDYLFAMKKLGYSSYWMEVGSNGGTKLTDAVLGNKYTIYLAGGSPAGAKTVFSNGQFEIAENAPSLPIGFVMKSDRIADLEQLPDGTRFQTQEALFRSLFSSGESLFTEYQPTALENVTLKRAGRYRLTVRDGSPMGVLTYSIPVKGRQTLYFDCFDRLTNHLSEPINSSFTVVVNGREVELDYPSQADNGLVDLGTYADCTVEVKIGVRKDVSAQSFGLAGLRDGVLDRAVAAAAPASLSQSGNTLAGTAFADAGDEYLFLPVSYAAGFSAEVNGKPAEVSRVFDSFLAVKLEKGENRVSVSYLPAGFRPGLALTIAGLLCLAVCVAARRKGKRFPRAGFWPAAFTALFAVLFALVAFLIYVFPLAVYFTG